MAWSNWRAWPGEAAEHAVHGCWGSASRVNQLDGGLNVAPWRLMLMILGDENSAAARGCCGEANLHRRRRRITSKLNFFMLSGCALSLYFCKESCNSHRLYAWPRSLNEN